MDNYWILGKSVEIKVSSKMAGYKMNLPFNAEFYSKILKLKAAYDKMGFVRYGKSYLIYCQKK